MKNAILLHGKPGKEEYYNPKFPSASNSHWFPWLQKQLLVHDIKADTPEAPFAYDPKWSIWVKEVERFEIRPDTILVGHSCGGGFWVRYLSEHPELKVGKVILVAPWINLNHEEDSNFFNFKINPDIVKQADEFSVFASDNDSENVKASVEHLRKRLKEAKFIDFHNYGHFCYEDLGTDKLPELLEECLK